MSIPAYLPTRHELLNISAFHRHIHARRQQYVDIDYDQPTEIYTSQCQIQATVDETLLIVAKQAERAAEYTLVSERMGKIVARAVSGELVGLNWRWMNQSHWDPTVPRGIAQVLGYCVVHDAFFEVTLRVNMEWFGEMGVGLSKAVVLAHQPRSDALCIRLN